MSRVAVIFTGGTISMVADAGAGGKIPTLDGAAILARAPGIGKIAEPSRIREVACASQPRMVAASEPYASAVDTES